MLGISYRTWKNFGGGKNWRIWRIVNHSPIFIRQLFRNTRKYRYLINVKNFEIDKLAGLLKYFKRRCDMQKKDAGTLPDPDGPLSRDIPSSSIGIANTHVHKCNRKHQVTDYEGHIFC